MAEEKSKTTNEESKSETSESSAKAENTQHLEGSSAPKEKRKIRDGYMTVKVYSPYQIYFDEEAKSISAINDTGPFDILPQHHKFLTLLSPCELAIVTDKGEEKIKISRGIMYVKEDRVTVFLDV